MDKETLIRAGINYEEGVKRFMGKAALYERLLAELPNDETFSELERAMGAGDVQAAFQAAHALKGMLGNLSVNGPLEQLKPLVEALRGSNLEQAATLYPSVKTALEQALNVIREEAK